MSLLRTYVVAERYEIMRQDLKFCIIGREDGLSPAILKEVHETIDLSAGNQGMTLCLALNYGSRIEIVDAVRDIAKEVASGTLRPEEIDEQTIGGHLYTAGMYDPDLVIRTSGEMRISNFLLWQISYAELWVTHKHWPEFRAPDLFEALRDYAARERRFGDVQAK